VLGNIQTLNQLIAQLLGGSNVPSPEVLTFLINAAAAQSPPGTTPATSPLAPAPTAVPTTPPISVPAFVPPTGVLPPPIYETTNQSQTSPN
jgi:hypothetical protein